MSDSDSKREEKDKLTQNRTQPGIKETQITSFTPIFPPTIKEVQTALLKAIQSDNLEEVRNIIEQNIIDIDSSLVGYKPVIWIAVSSHDPRIFEYLLSKNPNLRIEGLSHHVLRAQWDSTKKEQILATLVEKGLPPILPHFQAAAFGHLHILKECKKEQLTAKDSAGLTLLHFAAMNGRLETVRWLVIEVGVKMNEKDDYYNTSTEFAARYGHIETLKFLTEKRLKITDRIESDESAFLLAAGNGHLNIVNWFVKKGQPKAVDSIPLYSTALLEATKFGHVEVAHFLLTEGGSKINECNHEQSTALHHAACHGHLELVKLLVSYKIKANIHARDNLGNTPLILAARNSFLDIAQHLLLNGADIRDRNNKGSTLLMEAILNDSLGVIKFLLAQPGINIHQRDKEGNTALLIAASKSNKALAIVLIEKYGANPSDQNLEGDTIYALCPSWVESKSFFNELFLNHRKKQYSEMAKLILDNATSEFLIPPLRNIVLEYLINPNPITSTELAEILPKDLQVLQASTTKPSDIIFGYAIDPPKFEEEDSFWEHIKKSADNLLEPLIKYADINEGLSRRLLEEIHCDYPYDKRMIRRVVQAFIEKYREEINSTLSEILNVIVADTSYLETLVQQIASPEEFPDSKEKKLEKQLEKAPLSIKDKPIAHFARALNSPKPAHAPTSPNSNDKEEEGFNFISCSEKI